MVRAQALVPSDEDAALARSADKTSRRPVLKAIDRPDQGALN
jgi:hypothetical protein